MDSRYVKQKKLKQTRVRYARVVSAIVLVIVAAVGIYFWKFHNTNSEATSATQPTGTKQDQDAINYSPPSDQDKQDVNQTKENLSEQQSQAPTTNSSGKRSVNAVVTSVYIDGDNVRAMAFVGGVVENGGKCTFTFKKGSATVTKSTTAQADATTTNCETLEFAKSGLTLGIWSVTMDYSSTSSQGSSNTGSLEVK